MDHMDQEPLDFAAAITLLLKAREEVKRLRVFASGEIPWDPPASALIGYMSRMRLTNRHNALAHWRAMREALRDVLHSATGVRE
jgi:hypothetical protein